MQRAVPARGRLVLVPIPENVAEADVVIAMRAFLAEHSGGPRSAAVVTWSDDTNLVVRDIEAHGPDAFPNATRTLQSELVALLGELFDTTVHASWSAGADAGGREPQLDELSLSFLREVHDFVTPRTPFVALLTDWVDPGAIVRELRHLRGLRVIYGGVPPRWAANSG